MADEHTAEGRWKDNPVVVSAIAVGATITVCIAVVGAWVLPTATAKIEQERDHYKALATERGNELGALNLKLNAATSDATSKAGEISTLRREIRALHTDRIFSPVDVYPLGFREVRIGDEAKKIEGIYGKKAIASATKVTVTVIINDALFSRVLYDLSPCSKVARVAYIRFRLQDPTDRVILEKKAKETYGEEAIASRPSEIDTTEDLFMRPIRGAVGVIRNGGFEIDQGYNCSVQANPYRFGMESEPVSHP